MGSTGFSGCIALKSANLFSKSPNLLCKPLGSKGCKGSGNFILFCISAIKASLSIDGGFGMSNPPLISSISFSLSNDGGLGIFRKPPSEDDMRNIWPEWNLLC